MTENTKENLDIETMIYEAREKMRRQGESIEAVGVNAKTLFSSSSIIIGLLGVVQLSQYFQDVFKERCSGIITGVIIFLYIFLVIISLIVLSPKNYLGPIELSYTVLCDAFYGKTEREILEMQLSAYLNVIDKNEPGIKRRRFMTIIQSIIFALIVVLVIVAGMILPS